VSTRYLLTVTSFVTTVVLLMFGSLLLPLRLGFALLFMSVPTATCTAIALGLDYGIFLISRVVEFRERGFSEKRSIVQAVSKTGGIISSAGMIMALAFSGLYFSHKLLHRQFALILIASVLLDAFVVRTILVPASLGGRPIGRGQARTHCEDSPGRFRDDDNQHACLLDSGRTVGARIAPPHSLVVSLC